MKMSRLQKLLELKIHLEYARCLLDELAMEVAQEETRLKEEEE